MTGDGEQGSHAAVESGMVTQDVRGVDVGYWNPVREGRPVDNFGDVLGPLLIARIVGVRPNTGRSHGRVLVGQGSIAHLAPEGAVLWGTGVNGKVSLQEARIARDLDVRAVRGPWTRRVLQHVGLNVPEVYGDPASLVGRLYPELQLVGERARVDALCVPNFHDVEWLGAQARAHGMAVLHPQTPVANVLEAIASAGFVVGSSLHAVIIAEALGIPARFIVSETESAFKYLDYLAGTGRPHELIADSVADAVTTGGMSPAVLNTDELLDAFPWDMWGNERLRPPASSRGHAQGGTDEWFRTWSVPSARSRAQIASYVSSLDALADANLTGTDADVDAALDSAVQNRIWFNPSARTEEVGDAFNRSVDISITKGDYAASRRMLRQQRRGYCVTLYDLHRTQQATVVSLTVDTPAPADAVREIVLTNVHGNDLRVTTTGLTISPTQTRLDLDVLTEEAFEPNFETDEGATVYLQSGRSVKVRLDRADWFPPLT